MMAVREVCWDTACEMARFAADLADLTAEVWRFARRSTRMRCAQQRRAWWRRCWAACGMSASPVQVRHCLQDAERPTPPHDLFI